MPEQGTIRQAFETIGASIESNADHAAELDALEARQKAAGSIEGDVPDELAVAYFIHVAAAPGSHLLFSDFRRRWLLDKHSGEQEGNR